LWADIANYVSQPWNDFLTACLTGLELQHNLDVNNGNHIWLLQHLFLIQLMML
ncbi:hypothetical protein BT96DRAFT_821735, partial [Gymnopus androsaceus JB14]